MREKVEAEWKRKEHSKRKNKRTKIQVILKSSHTFCLLSEWNQVKFSQMPVLSLVILCLGLGERVKMAPISILAGSAAVHSLLVDNIYIFFPLNASKYLKYTYLFIYLFNKVLLNTCNVPDIFLDIEKRWKKHLRLI